MVGRRKQIGDEQVKPKGIRVCEEKKGVGEEIRKRRIYGTRFGQTGMKDKDENYMGTKSCQL